MVGNSSDPERVLCLVASSPTRAEFLNISVLSCDWSRLTAPLERSQRDCYSSRDSAPAPQYKLLWWQISVGTSCWLWPWEGAWSYGKHTFRTLKFSNPWFGLLRGSWGSTVLCILRRVSSRLTKIGADQVGIRVREDLLTRPWPSLTHQGLWWSQCMENMVLWMETFWLHFSFGGWLMVLIFMLVKTFYAEGLSSFTLVMLIVNDVILLTIPSYTWIWALNSFPWQLNS